MEAVEAANFRGSKVEAGSGKRVPLPLSPFISNVTNLNVVQFFCDTTKSECSIDNHLQKSFLKVVVHLDPEQPPCLSTQR